MEQGLQQGREEGIEQGLQRGMEQEKISSVKKLMEKLGMSKEEACNVIGVPVDKIS